MIDPEKEPIYLKAKANIEAARQDFYALCAGIRQVHNFIKITNYNELNKILIEIERRLDGLTLISRIETMPRVSMVHQSEHIIFNGLANIKKSFIIIARNKLEAKETVAAQNVVDDIGHLEEELRNFIDRVHEYYDMK